MGGGRLKKGKLGQCACRVKPHTCARHGVHVVVREMYWSHVDNNPYMTCRLVTQVKDPS